MCTSAGNHPYAEAWWPDAHVLGYEHCFTNMLADVCRAIARKKPELPIPDFEDAYQTQRVLEAALLSARNRTAIKLSERAFRNQLQRGLGSNYELQDLIGRGGFGAVYSAWDVKQSKH